MAIELGLYWDIQADEQVLMVRERIGTEEYAIEAGTDGRWTHRLIKRGERREPLMRFSAGIGSEILQALAVELDKKGYKVPNPHEGALDVTKDALVDARTIRDRLLAIVERP